MDDLLRRLSDCCMKAAAAGAAFADARATSARGFSLLVQDGRAERLAASAVRGVGVRVLCDGAWGFASADTFDESALERARIGATAAARASARRCRDPVPAALPCGGERDDAADTPARRPLDDWTIERKIARLTAIERAGAAAAGPACLNSVLSYGEGERTDWLANSAGASLRQSAPHCQLTCTITAHVGEVRQQATEHKAHVGGLDLLADLAADAFSVKAAARVLRQCRAPRPAGGAMPVIFGPSVSGLLAHEALGHNAEADSYYAGQSILQGRLGQPIAAAGVTIVDDATVPGAYGSYAWDDEGTPAARRAIVAGGVFAALLHSLETAARFGQPPNGCGRADGHACQPLVRMSNTFVEPNPDGPSFEQMVRSVERGVYLEEGSEGYVFPERGQFICRAESARRIEHGQLGEHLRDVSVSGLLLETLQRIDMIGSDFRMALPGVCGKLGQGVPTDCGGPHLRVSSMTVAGE